MARRSIWSDFDLFGVKRRLDAQEATSAVQWGQPRIKNAVLRQLLTQDSEPASVGAFPDELPVEPKLYPFTNHVEVVNDNIGYGERTRLRSAAPIREPSSGAGAESVGIGGPGLAQPQTLQVVTIESVRTRTGDQQLSRKRP